jgi:flagellar basal body-associated protein FliL
MSTPSNGSSGGKKKLIVLFAVTGILSLGAGATAPLFLLRGAQPARDTQEVEKPGPDAPVAFGEVTVNLADGRLNRYLRVKILLVVDGKQLKRVEAALEERKPILKNWLITHLSDKTLADVTGRVSINRIRREIQEAFSARMFPEGDGHLRDVLFEEFVVQ